MGEDRVAKLLFLAGVSRLLQHPVSCVVKGASSSGKSVTVETVFAHFPASAYYALSSMSERSLAYSEEPLAHRILILYEAAGMTSDLATYLMRSLLSEGVIRYETVEKTAQATLRFRQRGCCRRWRTAPAAGGAEPPEYSPTWRSARDGRRASPWETRCRQNARSCPIPMRCCRAMRRMAHLPEGCAVLP